MNKRDIRWAQRFSNYSKAFLRLKKAVELSRVRALSDLEVQGLVQGFEYSFELAWRTLKDYLAYGGVDAKFPREVIKKGFQYDLVGDGDVWMDMLEQCHLMAHTYDEDNAKTAYELITTPYYQQLEALLLLFEQKLKDAQIWCK